ncbi:MAG: hypothetical protein KDC85_13045 [Saprospiraceae bacterium]|nr:hypothetical protein [Saprospiraceae bacterium]MCB9325485.1 hypothetical protein [Lewinellaceae bacterium]
MNKLIKYVLIAAIPAALLFLGCDGFQKKQPEQNEGQTGVLKETNHIKAEGAIEIALADLKIIPERTLENEVYLLTAFDVPDKKTLVFVGNFDRKNRVRFFDLKTNEITAELILPETPLDVYTLNGSCYILGEKSIFVLADKQIVRTIRHDIPGVFNFDRLLALDGQLFVSMSDGSAWEVGETGVRRLKKLPMNGHPLWIQKRSPKTFSIDLGESKTVSYKSDLMLGSMTILGALNDNLICVIEKITGQQPLVVERAIASSSDDFASDLQTVDSQPYAFLKNDLRLHGNRLCHLILHPDKALLVTERIK